MSQDNDEVRSQADVSLDPGTAFQELCGTLNKFQLLDLHSSYLYNGVIIYLAELLQY